MNTARGVGSVACVVLAASAGVGVGVAQAQPSYEIVRLGLTGPRYTWQGSGPFPEQVSTLFSLAGTPGSGVASGASTSYYIFGQGDRSSQDAWGWSASTGTVQIGLLDATHTSVLGIRRSAPVAADRTGLVAGHSSRYHPSVDAELGQSAWAWSPSSGSVPIGLTGPGTVHGDGARFDEVLTAGGGTVGGTTSVMQAGQPSSLHAWAWREGMGTTRVGLVGPAYANSEGREFSTVRAAGDSGVLAGVSVRFQGTNEGSEAWVWSQALGTRQAGLLDADHTNAAGLRSANVERVGAGGHVLGRSLRFAPGSLSFGGQSAWAASPDGATARLGFFDAEHRSSAGEEISTPRFVNVSGLVAGESIRYAGENDRGQSAWVQRAGQAPTRIGPVDALHTSANGTRVSFARSMNDAGIVVGASNNYAPGASEWGRSAWCWTPEGGGSTQRLGLFTGGYVRPDGVTISDPFGVTPAGDIAGISIFYGDLPFSPRQRAWYFDSFTSITHTIVPSVPLEPALWTVEPSQLTPDGFVFGRYSTGIDPIARSFGWSVATGFFDLGDRVQGGLNGAGWAWLNTVASAPESGLLAGVGGVTTASGQAIYLLQVPTPGTLVLGGLAAGMAARRVRRLERSLR